MIEFKELFEFIEIQDERLIKGSGSFFSERERVLSRTAKLTEELGELCDEVLASNGDQREKKLNGKSKETLSHEFADVFITTLLLAKTMDVDIVNALEGKIEKINKRYEDL